MDVKQTFIRKEYLKNHLMNVHVLTLGQARHCVLYSARESDNTFKEKIDDFDINLLDESRKVVDNNDVKTTEVEINSEEKQQNIYNDISSDEYDPDDSIDIGQELDISIHCEEASDDHNNDHDDISDDKLHDVNKVKLIVENNYHSDVGINNNDTCDKNSDDDVIYESADVTDKSSNDDASTVLSNNNDLSDSSHDDDTRDTSSDNVVVSDDSFDYVSENNAYDDVKSVDAEDASENKFGADNDIKSVNDDISSDGNSYFSDDQVDSDNNVSSQGCEDDVIVVSDDDADDNTLDTTDNIRRVTSNLSLFYLENRLHIQRRRTRPRRDIRVWRTLV